MVLIEVVSISIHLNISGIRSYFKCNFNILNNLGWSGDSVRWKFEQVLSDGETETEYFKIIKIA